MPPDLMESANPGCPEQFRAGDIISLGGQCLASSGQNVYSVAQELNLKPYDIVRFTAELNPIYPLQAGSILIVPLPHACADQSSDFLLRHACTGFAVTNLSYRGGTLIHSETSIKEIIAVRCNYLSQNSVLMEQHAPDSEVFDTSTAASIQYRTTNHVLRPPPPVDECFLMQINEDFNSPETIVQMYPQEQLLEGVLNQNKSTTYLQYMSSLYKAAQMESMTNVHLLQLHAVDMPLTGWCVLQPSAAADANIAAQLSAFIEAVLPEWTKIIYSLSVQI
ncbi:MAG: hypothetical protein FRX49_12479 [Trebouxia sp. A1-2]|nr:MAG: hypothetical protein FRX49_12479 [Trebouxia sp. A1-2]